MTIWMQSQRHLTRNNKHVKRDKQNTQTSTTPDNLIVMPSNQSDFYPFKMSLGRDSDYLRM